MTGLAKFVSGVLHPLCMPLLTLGLLLATDGYLAHRLGLFSYLFVLLLINTLAPALSMFILKKRGVISDWDIRMRHERPWPFLLVLAYYLMAYVLVVSSTAVEVPLFYQNVLLSLVVAIASHEASGDDADAEDTVRAVAEASTYDPLAAPDPRDSVPGVTN